MLIDDMQRHQLESMLFSDWVSAKEQRSSVHGMSRSIRGGIAETVQPHEYWERTVVDGHTDGHARQWSGHKREQVHTCAHLQPAI